MATQPLANTISGSPTALPPAGAENDGQISGNPSIPAASRSIVNGTSVGKTNNELAHVCDFVSEMQKNIGLKKFLKSVASKIREGIRAIMQLLGLEPTGQYSWLINKLKSIARELKRIQKEIIQPIIDFEKYVLAYVTKLRAIVAWILELPARFLTLLKDCLARLLKLIGSVFSDFFAELTGGGASSEITELVSAAKEVAAEAYKTVSLTTAAVVGAAAIPVAATAGLLVPVSQSELDAASKTITNYTSTFPSANTIAASTAIEAQQGTSI